MAAAVNARRADSARRRGARPSIGAAGRASGVRRAGKERWGGFEAHLEGSPLERGHFPRCGGEAWA